MKHFLGLFLLLNSWTLSSQAHPYAVQFSHQIESAIKNESINPTRAGLLYSLIGAYHESILLSDIPVSWGLDSVDVSQFELSEALPAIISEAKYHQLVIISENHLKPQHRIFAKKIINELSKCGYKHLGIETLASINNSNTLLDAKLVERGYPLGSPMTGTYTLEPQMADLVRSAIVHNYTLFAYERSEKIEGKDRDEIQADNIIKYLKAHPDEKMIIYCGFHHAIESDLLKYGKFKWMAKHLKDKTGIDPLTIYQDNFTEKFLVNQHPFLSSIDIYKPSVFIDKEGQIAQISKHVDIEIVHPKTTYIEGRANWLFESENHQLVPINTSGHNLKYPIIAAAYLSNEGKGVPIDRIELLNEFDKNFLVLAPGTYTIVLNDGIQQKESTLTIK